MVDVMKGNLTETGIKESCIFNKLKCFHVVKNVGFDLIMHDGPAKYEMPNITVYT